MRFGLLVYVVVPLSLCTSAVAASFRPRLVQQIAAQTLPASPGSEPDTLSQPSVASDPADARRVAAVFQEGRFPTGIGSIALGTAASQDAGAHWTLGHVQGLTSVVAGTYDRAADNSIAFGPNREIYVISIALDMCPDCSSVVAVQRSDDGGATFTAPVLVDDGAQGFNDKSWITADTFTAAASPHSGRVYAAWVRLSSGASELASSDDGGVTWSPAEDASAPGRFTHGPIPVVQPNGDVTVVYWDKGPGTDTGPPYTVVSRTSHDGGSSFATPVVVATFEPGDPGDLVEYEGPAATVDRATGTLVVAWRGQRLSGPENDIFLSTSNDGGATWNTPARVNRRQKRDCFMPAVAADNAVIHVTFSARVGNSVETRHTASIDSGKTFAGERIVGRRSVLTYAAIASYPTPNRKFLGAYMGIAAAGGRTYAVWARALRPPFASNVPCVAPTGLYHQTLWSSTIE